MTEFKDGTVFKVVDIEAMGMVEDLGYDGLPDAWPWLMEALSMAVDAGAVVPVEPDVDVLAETLSDFEPCKTVKDRHYDQARHVLRVLGIGGSDDES